VSDVLSLADLDALRSWLGSDDAAAGEVWLGFHRVRFGADPGPALLFGEAADELAVAGWAEGERRAVDDGSYAVRFAPGKVTRKVAAPGDAWPRERGDMPLLDPAYEAEFRADEAAWAFFEEQPPRYRRAAIWWVISGKSEQTRRRRLAGLIEGSAAGEKLPQLVRQL